MPHISIKHFPRPFTETEKADLVASLTETVTRIFDVDPGAVSIAVEPVEPSLWTRQVHIPDIDEKARLLWKQPDYSHPLPATPPAPAEGTR
ncbi:tautomerase family protein [Streptantibioticus parmotrematis]|uniref:tautomerase family protein n=1 Tax=Streptantibioticus parmotrematis TaxID=2873249 RepID=UPI0033DF1EC4